MQRAWWMVLLLAACPSAPLLQNAPRPNPAVVAGAAAVVAGAATLADPQGAAQRQEIKDQHDPDDRGVEVHETVPAAVLDRLDRGDPDAGVTEPAPPPSPP